VKLRFQNASPFFSFAKTKEADGLSLPFFSSSMTGSRKGKLFIHQAHCYAWEIWETLSLFFSKFLSIIVNPKVTTVFISAWYLC